MTVTARIEKHKGITLTVLNAWVTVIHDATGYQVAGPVKSDTDVVAFVQQAVPFLQSFAFMRSLGQ
jgi:hypothetical protein